MIKASNLSKSYGELNAVKNISFSVENKGVYGFLGPNGAGKSTTMNMITGCISPSCGSVCICGHDMVKDPSNAKKHIGYLPENPPLYQDMTPREFLTFVARAKRVPAERIDAHVSEVIERTDIASVSSRLIAALSKGYKQRVGISMALIGNPDILIFDEPTVGLDPHQIIGVRRLIRSLGKERTVILSSHILSEIEEICDHIIIINNGEIVANAPLKDITDASPVIHLETRESAADVTEAILSVESVDSVNRSLHSSLRTYRIIPETGCDTLDLRERISALLYSAAVPIVSLYEEKLTLERKFLSLTASEAEFDELDEADGGDDSGSDLPDDDGDTVLPSNENAESTTRLLTLDEIYARAARKKEVSAEAYSPEGDSDETHGGVN